MANKIPGQIGPYTLHEELGRGGMSIVFRAVDARSDRAVALKVLPMELAYNNTFLGRFLREGENALRLQHPNIVRAFEADQHEGHHFIAMEWAQGGTLSERIRRRQGPLPVDEVLTVLQQIAAGLDHAHSLGFLHRDIKPSNIMFADADDTSRNRALLADFGVAKDLSADHTMVTMPGFSVGTPAYMSPEQARGDLDIDQRADVYSLGVVAYAALTGRMPFEADSQLVLLRKIVDEMPIPPESANPQLPPGVAYVLKCVLAKDPAARYATAGEFAYALTQSVSSVDTVGMEATIPMLPSALRGGTPKQNPTPPPSYGGRPAQSAPPPAYAPAGAAPPSYAPAPSTPMPYAPAPYAPAQSSPIRRMAGWLAMMVGAAALAVLVMAFLNGNLTFQPTPRPSADAAPTDAAPVDAAPADAVAAAPTTAPVPTAPVPTAAITQAPDSASAGENGTVTVAMPAPQARLPDDAAPTRFVWQSPAPAAGQGLELLFWPQQAGLDGWQVGRSAAGLLRSAPQGEEWVIEVDLDAFARAQTDGFFAAGDYYWGIATTDVQPYQRRSLISEPRRFTYIPQQDAVAQDAVAQDAVAQAAAEVACIGECARD